MLEKMDKYELLNSVQQDLKLLQDRTIGLGKPTSSNNFECIISKEDGLITLLSIGLLLGTSTLVITESECVVHYFPDNKTLTEMMETPLEFNAWFIETVK